MSCKKTVKVVRIDMDKPKEKHVWLCDKCYFAKKK